MQTLKKAFSQALGLGTLAFSLPILLSACSSGDSATVDGDVAIAYVKRPTTTLGNPTDAIMFTAGGDLYLREKSSASAAEINITGPQTNGLGDVSDPEVSYDGKKLLFSMRRAADAGWRVWEYDIAGKALRGPIACVASGITPAGDDVDPAYLPDGRIVFASNRQVTSQQVNGFAYLDEYERERVTALHVMNGDGTNCRQISYNQSHDRNPTVLQTGEIMYSRWDHVGGRNQFSIFFTNPDGTNLFVLYGAHSPGNSYLHPREMPSGQVLSTLMPLSRTSEGGALMQIDIKNYSENTEPAPGVAPGGSGQRQPTAQPINFGSGISQYGRYSTPYPLWDGTNRVLVSWTPSQPQAATNPLTGAPETVEGTPVYGVYMLNLDNKSLRPVVTAPAGYSVLDPVAIQSRPVPNIITDKNLSGDLANRGVGILNVKSVYDTDGQGRMGSAVLVTGESIPMLGGVPDILRLKDPALTTSAAQRPARFVRITRAVPTQSGISRELIGETEFEMQQILGYTEVEPDGSFKIEVPADVPVAITVIDKDGRGFTPHTNWIQVRPGETRTCNGCHSPRRGNSINAAPIAGDHPNTLLPAALGESMAETRTRLFSTVLALKPHLEYADVWTNPAAAGRAADAPLTINYDGIPVVAERPVNGVIDFPTHIQPMLTRNCAGCHNNNIVTDPRSKGLDLRPGLGAGGRELAYDELLIGDPVLCTNPASTTPPCTIGLPIIEVVDDELRVRRSEAQVSSGTARGSHLIEVLFNSEIRSALPLAPLPRTDHSPMLNASEKRLMSEWIDVGAQYFNSPRDAGGALRGVTGLDQGVFNTGVYPILRARCATCHQAVGLPGTGGTTPNPGFVGRRYVLTGQAEGDYNVTLSMVGNVSNPAITLLLSRPASDGISPNPAHGVVPIVGGPVMPAGSPDYLCIARWIQGAACP